MPVENEPTQIKSGMCSSKGHVTLLEEMGLTRSGRLGGYLRAGLQISPDRRHRWRSRRQQADEHQWKPVGSPSQQTIMLMTRQVADTQGHVSSLENVESEVSSHRAPLPYQLLLQVGGGKWASGSLDKEDDARAREGRWGGKSLGRASRRSADPGIKIGRTRIVGCDLLVH
jgi:hypothetical protein